MAASAAETAVLKGIVVSPNELTEEQEKQVHCYPVKTCLQALIYSADCREDWSWWVVG